MKEEQIKKHLENLAENLDEILSSTAALKGEKFADGIAIAFECTQIIEISARLAAVAQEEHKEYASALAESQMNILASIAAKACSDLGED